METYTVVLKVSKFNLELDKTVTLEKEFTFTDYDDVQNIIGYMVDGSKELDIRIKREVVA